MSIEPFVFLNFDKRSRASATFEPRFANIVSSIKVSELATNCEPDANAISYTSFFVIFLLGINETVFILNSVRDFFSETTTYSDSHFLASRTEYRTSDDREKALEDLSPATQLQLKLAS